MSKSALFQGLPASECSDIASLAKVRTYFRTEALFRQGDLVRKLVWIRTGRVKLIHTGADGHEVLLWVKGPGHAADLHGLTTNCSHQCSGRAVDRCDALVWDCSTFRELAVRSPRINANIAKMLAERLHEIEERFCEIATQEVPDRLASALLRLADSMGKPSRFGVELELSRQELAGLTGTTLFTVSRTLSKWAQAGLVVTRRGGVVIQDPERLRAFRGPVRMSLNSCPRRRDQSALRDSYSPSEREA